MPAGIGRRAVALLADVTLVSVIASAAGAGIDSMRPGASSLLFFLLLLLSAVVVQLGYFVLLERILGATVGKLLLGLRVVGADGSRPGWASVVMRNVLKPIDWFLVFLVFSPLRLPVPSIWMAPNQQRLGDRVANTLVIRTGPRDQMTLLESRPASRRLLFGALVSAAAVYSLLAAFALGLLSAVQPVDSQGEAFLGALQQGDYARAYGLGSSELRRSSTEANFQRAIEQGKSRPSGWRVTSWRVLGGRATMEGPIDFVDGSTGVFLVGLVRDDERWLVENYRWRRAP